MAHILAVLMVLAGLFLSASNLQAEEVLKWEPKPNGLEGERIVVHNDDFTLLFSRSTESPWQPIAMAIVSIKTDGSSFPTLRLFGQRKLLTLKPGPEGYGSRKFWIEVLKGQEFVFPFYGGHILVSFGKDKNKYILRLYEEGVGILSGEEFWGWILSPGGMNAFSAAATEPMHVGQFAVASKSTAAVESASWGSVKNAFSGDTDDEQLEFVSELFK